MSIIIYHNPRCSKSRQALKLIRDNKLEPTIVEYLKNPPDIKTIEGLLNMLKMRPRDIMRTKEPDYKNAGISNPNLTRKQLVQALAAYPSLIERPIIVINEKAVIGRPPEKLLSLLN
jgi:arsenate reductase|tara:strand:- start:8 stop:358 length:351 start_codon:yes stop_codon:yes gene_type:complete